MKRAMIACILLACRAETAPPDQKPIDPPVSSPETIPDAPVSGTIHGAPFVARDMRYVVDERIGYAHTDIKLSAGHAENACDSISPAKGASVWLRLEDNTWSVQYQVFDDGRWIGVHAAKALVSIRGVSPDGHMSGGLAVCFSDDSKSCVSGSFEAVDCPSSIDQPVRGSQSLERMISPPNPDGRDM